LLNILPATLSPFYQKPLAKKGLEYGLCSLTHVTAAAAQIKNKVMRLIAMFFAFLVDASLGFGLINTMLYNSYAFLYNNTYARIRNYYIEKQQHPNWKLNNPAAIRNWGIIIVIAVGCGLIHRYNGVHALRNLLSTYIPSLALPAVTSSNSPSAPKPPATAQTQTPKDTSTSSVPPTQKTTVEVLQTLLEPSFTRGYPTCPNLSDYTTFVMVALNDTSTKNSSSTSLAPKS
jgi:hypothetical protein